MKLKHKLGIVVIGLALLGAGYLIARAAQQAVGGGGSYFFPRPINVTGAPSLGTLTLTHATATVAEIMEAPKTGDICKIGFRTGAETVSSTMMVNLETVSTSTGNVTGNLFSTNSQVETIPLQAANTFKEWTLNASATVAMGQLIGIHLVPTSTAGVLNMAITNFSAPNSREFPYQENAIGTSTYTKSANSLAISLQYCDGTYAYQGGVMPLSNNGSLSYNTSTAAQSIVGIKYTPKVPQTVVGVWADMAFTLNTSYGIYYLYDGSNNVLASTTVWGGVISGVASVQTHEHYFANSVALSANSTYRLVLTSEFSQNVQLAQYTVASSAMMNALVGSTDVSWTAATGSLLWTDTATQLPAMGFILSSFDDGVQTGGSGGGGGFQSWWDGF